MILSGQTIRGLCIKPPYLIQPFSEKAKFQGLSYGLSHCGYDVRLSHDLRVPHEGYALGATIEQFNMPLNIVGRVHDKSTLARLGIFVQNTIIEPGWRGFLTVEISNLGYTFHDLKAGQPIAQIVFEYTDFPVESPYEGKYQDQEAGPQEARYDDSFTKP